MNLIRRTFTVTCFLVCTTNFAQASAISYNYDSDYVSMNSCTDIPDPFESVNRKIFYFNGFADMILLKPIAVAYDRSFNNFTKTRIGDFVDNVREPLTAVNYLLQLDLKHSVRSVSKFFLNTTFGLFGFFDIGTKMGLNHPAQNFGSTLARYGARPGPYIVLPLLGSTNMRDMWNIIVFDNALNPITYGVKEAPKNIYTVVRVIQKRQEVTPFTDFISQTSNDPYVSIRSAYHQNRENSLVYPDGYRCGVKIKKD